MSDNMLKQKAIPQHVAIIMDGNGRWAKQHGKERYEGHIAGVESVRRVLRAATTHGVKYLTLYAFSTENWGRPAAEVEAIMELFCKSVVAESPELIREGVKVQIIGERRGFSSRVVELIDQIERATEGGERLTLVLAFNYSSRRELMLATQDIARRVKAGEISADEISEQTIAQSLMTRSMPDPDLIIRTSGECRLSNFLLWQASYAEFYFPEVLWPDFDEEEFEKALEVFASRDRRDGLVTEE